MRASAAFGMPAAFVGAELGPITSIDGICV